MRDKILVINTVQFGYHVGTFKYVMYLRDNFNITYLCFDNKKEKIEGKGINTFYVNYEGNFVNRGYSFLKIAYDLIKSNDYSLVFIVYFQGASLLKLLFPNKIRILHLYSCSPCVYHSPESSFACWSSSIPPLHI